MTYIVVVGSIAKVMREKPAADMIALRLENFVVDAEVLQNHRRVQACCASADNTNLERDVWAVLKLWELFLSVKRGLLSLFLRSKRGHDHSFQEGAGDAAEEHVGDALQEVREPEVILVLFYKVAGEQLVVATRDGRGREGLRFRHD
jgi:hypothetical protein